MNRINQLQQLLKLEQRRQELQSELDKLNKEFASIGEGMMAERPPAGAAVLGSAAPAPVAAPKRPARASGKREARGSLKERVLSMLAGAGAEGISVREIAETLGTKAQNIHSWFNNTGRKNPAIKKVGEARYSLDSSAGLTSTKAAAAPASKKTAGLKKSASKSGGSARGELRDKILTELKASGSNGVTVKELSEKVGVPYKNVSIWFSTTGRKHSEIKKVGPARYAID